MAFPNLPTDLLSQIALPPVLAATMVGLFFYTLTQSSPAWTPLTGQWVFVTSKLGYYAWDGINAPVWTEPQV